MRILYIQRGLVPPPKDPRLEQFHFLSEQISGDILLPVWFTKPEEVEQELGPGSYPMFSVANFRYHQLLAGSKTGLRDRWEAFRFYVRKGKEVYRQQPYDCIVTYGHSLTAFAGIALKLSTGAKLILEVNSEPGVSYLFFLSYPMWVRRLMKWSSELLLHIAALFADRFRLLYPEQLSPYPLLRRVKTSIFHPFVPTSMAKPSQNVGRYLLLVGHPWYLKGADVMVKAFLKIAPEFPDVQLIMRGHYADASELRSLAAGCSQIQILKPLPYAEMLETIASALVVTQPTRTEGMSRVLIETMASGRPFVSTPVGGTPYYVSRAQCALIAKTGDVDDLVAKLRQILSDDVLRERFASNALAFARQNLTEKVYVEGFVKMLADTLSTGK